MAGYNVPMQSPMESALQGVAGALQGRERGLRFNEEVRQFDEQLAEGARQFDTQLAEGARQFDADLGHRVNQLRVLQEQNALSREQEERLTRFVQQQQNIRNAEQVAAQRYATAEQARANRRAHQLQQQAMYGNLAGRANSATAVVASAGGVDAVASMLPEQKQQLAQQLVSMRFGPEQLNEINVEQAMAAAMADIENIDTLQGEVITQARDMAQANWVERNNPREVFGTGVNRQALDSVHLNDMYSGTINNLTGRPDIDYEMFGQSFGPENARTVEMLDMQLASKILQARETAARGGSSTLLDEYAREAMMQVTSTLTQDTTIPDRILKQLGNYYGAKIQSGIQMKGIGGPDPYAAVDLAEADPERYEQVMADMKVNDPESYNSVMMIIERQKSIAEGI